LRKIANDFIAEFAPPYDLKRDTCIKHVKRQR
jgi:hypothetical protein